MGCVGSVVMRDSFGELATRLQTPTTVSAVERGREAGVMAYSKELQGHEEGGADDVGAARVQVIVFAIASDIRVVIDMVKAKEDI